MTNISELLQTVCVFAPEIYGISCVAILITFGICTKQY